MPFNSERGPSGLRSFFLLPQPVLESVAAI